MITCAYAVKLNKKYRALLVDCGPGKASCMLSTTFLRGGGILVCTDNNEFMLPKLANNFKNSEFSSAPGCIF